MEKEDRRKERSRVRHTGHRSVWVGVCVCVRCGSVGTTSHHFNNIYVLFLDVNQIEFELKLTL